MQKAQSVLFDLDGTLMDTAPDLVAALNVVLDSNNKPELSVDQARPYVSRGARGLLSRGFGLDEQTEDHLKYVEQFLDIYRKALCVESRLFEGMSAVLDTLDHDKIKWGVVTNKMASLTEPLLEQADLYDRMHVLVCGDTLAEKKPSPAPLLYACKKAGMVIERTIYVGDDPRDIQAARAAGMDSVAVRYGYYDASENPDEWGANWVIDHPHELLGFVDGLTL